MIGGSNPLGVQMREWSCRWETDTRYYATFAHLDLFGEWILHKQWGGKGSRLGGTRVVAVGCDAIRQALPIIERQRARAGYTRVRDIPFRVSN